MNNTWQTELLKELYAVRQGLLDATKPTTDIDQLIDKLEHTTADRNKIAQQMIRIGLAYFAGNVLNEYYEVRAEVENKLEQNVETEADS